MADYTYIILKVNKMNGDVEIMNNKNTLEKDSMKSIAEIYKMLNIPIKNDKNINGYEKVSKYDYNQKSLLDINTYAEI